MEVRKKTEAQRHENSPTCTAFEYGMSTQEIDSAVIELRGRYPEAGWAVNTVSIALIHVVRGEGYIYKDSNSIPLGEDDQILILPNEKYALEGEMKLLFSSSPAWSPEQARVIN